eukprot:TRINITY_DN1721_c0_g1_i1.p1 TRINITY_DN1721_c0_g1~~TRINITY_DN1721_c0_g1_i1.p1  ORF type:complete len:327 (-),score=74.71 TRINITY_DN1721_c0_g1_i1:13-993(-)
MCIRDRYKELHNFWIAVAKTFKDNTNVIGYEFINEPITGNLYENPFEFLDPFCRKAHTTLEPLYHSLAGTVRKIDPDHIIVFEASINGLFTTGFEKAPGGRQNISKQIFSYHIYCPLVDWSGCPKSSVFCEIFDSIMFYMKSLDKKHFGCGALLTEFGALSTVGTCIEETHRLLSKAEAYNDGWMYWQYKQYDDPTTANSDGTQGFFNASSKEPHVEKIKALTRPYMRKVAGRLTKSRFETGDNTFEVMYEVAPEFTNSTVSEIYVNLEYYGGNFPNVMVTDGVEISKTQIVHEVEGHKYALYTLDHKKLKGKHEFITVQMRPSAK